MQNLANELIQADCFEIQGGGSGNGIAAFFILLKFYTLNYVVMIINIIMTLVRQSAFCGKGDLLQIKVHNV